MGGKGFKQHGKVVWPGFSDVATRHVAKIGRNEPCPCGSDKKYKDSHEIGGSAYLEKLALERDRDRVRRERALMKEKGVPWYKRMLHRG